MAILPAVALAGSGLFIGGTVTSQLSTDAQSTGTTVAVIGAVAVVLTTIIGVVGSYMSNRRTAPSPPGADLDLPGLHNRVTIVEQIVHDVREDIAELEQHDREIDERVIPLGAVTDTKFEDVYRRLEALERRK